MGSAGKPDLKGQRARNGLRAVRRGEKGTQNAKSGKGKKKTKEHQKVRNVINNRFRVATIGQPGTQPKAEAGRTKKKKRTKKKNR